ncbi:MAG TPA: carbonic anhydrase, partial [Candidatus Saccharimonadales bacterium]|nr:carbonic anhydrase [Candidatus Saccharimonadales bacterium]
MRLFEAIIEANQRASSSGSPASLSLEQFSNALPVAALTCIDPRLNRFIPEALGLPEDQFIWLRNAGNMLTSPMSSTMRSLALACAIKGAREIVILGHSDCRVRQTSMLELTNRFKALGIDRSQLPDNVTEFFGLFASERQNVMHGVDLARQSPIIGPRMPVHGLMIDIQSGKLEWVVNGYEALAMATSASPAVAPTPSGWPALGPVTEFKISDMKKAEASIGDSASSSPMIFPAQTQAQAAAAREKFKPTIVPNIPLNPPLAPPIVPDVSSSPRLDRSAMYKVVGEDKKIYGPVSAEELERWIAENRVDIKSLAQMVGNKQWRTLESFLIRELE